MLRKIGFGGGCHWCTEAVFQAIRGVKEVQQGWVASNGKEYTFSEAVIVTYDPEAISLQILIEIHLHTHKSTSNHSMRLKYRSAIYYFDKEQAQKSDEFLAKAQQDFTEPLITKVLAFKGFRPSTEAFQNYYRKNTAKPFCQRYITPKLEYLLRHHEDRVKPAMEAIQA